MTLLQINDLIRELKNARIKYQNREDDLAVENIDWLVKAYEKDRTLSPQRIAFARKLVDKAIGMK